MNVPNTLVGFIGLGNMGFPMAENLINAGYKLNIFDVNQEPITKLKQKGASTFGTPKDVAESSDVIITMLPGPDVIYETYLGKDGIVHSTRPGLVLVDTSTASSEVVCDIGNELVHTGVKMIDAPVIGAPPIATAGKLIFLVGGDKEVVESLQQIFLVMGEDVIHCGPLGEGQKLKLTNNLMNAMYTMVLVEGFSLAQKSGVDIEILERLLGRNWPRILQNTFAKLAVRDLEPGFKLDLFLKDLNLALEMGKTCDSILPISSVGKSLFQMAIKSGYGNKSPISLLSIYEDISKA